MVPDPAILELLGAGCATHLPSHPCAPDAYQIEFESGWHRVLLITTLVPSPLGVGSAARYEVRLVRGHHPTDQLHERLYLGDTLETAVATFRLCAHTLGARYAESRSNGEHWLHMLPLPVAVAIERASECGCDVRGMLISKGRALLLCCRPAPDELVEFVRRKTPISDVIENGAALIAEIRTT